jgi:hypothetical protein
MTIPAGISTALVHMDAPVSFIGEPGRVYVRIQPSASLVWEETGTPLANFFDAMAPDNGLPMEIELPHTDQDGFIDGLGNTITGWFYTVTIKYEKDGQIVHFPSRDFQIPVGQTDVDLALIPSGDAFVPQVAPILPVTSIDGLNGEVTLQELGLDLVDNTPDTAKPISTATAAALAAKAPINNPTFTGTVSGVSKAMVGLGNADNTADTAKPVSTAQQAALDLKAPLASPTFTGTVSGVSKTMVGLGNADNTSDAAKPVSTATATALAAKAPLVGTADIEITDTAKGIILKSANGTRYRLGVADDGALTTTSL